MASSKECEFYPSCGFIKWREKNGHSFTNPIPLDGDCGIPIQTCARRVPKTFRPASNPDFEITTERPINTSEMHVGLRSYADDNYPNGQRFSIGSVDSD